MALRVEAGLFLVHLFQAAPEKAKNHTWVFPQIYIILVQTSLVRGIVTWLFLRQVFSVFGFMCLFVSLCPSLSFGFHGKGDLCCLSSGDKTNLISSGLPRLRMNTCFPWRRIRSPRDAVSL